MLLQNLCFQELYKGDGQHLGGLYKPLMIENQLTAAYEASKAPRPAGRAIGCVPDGSNLGLVWMVPIGLTAAGPISNEVFGAVVAAVDAWSGVLIHAETDEMAQRLGEVVLLFAGGGHA